MPVPPSIMNHAFYDHIDHPCDNYNFNVEKLLDVLRDMSFRISALEEANTRLSNRVHALEKEVYNEPNLNRLYKNRLDKNSKISKIDLL